MNSAALLLAVGASVSTAPPTLTRPPAVPLVANNPYFSAWSRTDRLTDGWATHWSGSIQGFCGLVRIDGKPMRFAGPFPQSAPAMKQVALDWTATRTIYDFEDAGVHLRVEFLSPLLPDDPDLASRAVTYLSITAQSTTNAPHDVSIYVDFTGEWAVHEPSQKVLWTRNRIGGAAKPGDTGLDILRIGTQAQPILQRAGDQTRIDWGWFTLAAANSPQSSASIAGHTASRTVFASTGRLADDDPRMPRAANDDWPVLAMSCHLGSIGGAAHTQAKADFILAQDEGECLEYFARRIKPYWARAGSSFFEMLADSATRHDVIASHCAEFDRSLSDRLARAGGAAYARLCTLVYRQSMAAHQIAADFDGTMLMFPKENSSNGCIGTVDVIFPTAPILLALNPELLKANLRPVLDYASSPRWKFPFAPHDLGTWPLANGQVYGGGERTEDDQMPVEESANMLILLAAIAKADGNADFASRWWPAVTKWAEYLKTNGLDPANQLCTDDFAGHLARNANLSIKAVIALGAYARLCELRGEKDSASRWRTTAQQYAAKWQELAADGDHTVLAFGKPGTWSLKYNLVWDNVLDLNLFPAELKAREVALYRSKMDRFGVPMDSREHYTKCEWTVWAACLSGRRDDFETLTAPIIAFASATPDRVPLSDWYTTTDARNKGMYARSVVGGMYMPLLLTPTPVK